MKRVLAITADRGQTMKLQPLYPIKNERLAVWRTRLLTQCLDSLMRGSCPCGGVRAAQELQC